MGMALRSSGAAAGASGVFRMRWLTLIGLAGRPLPMVAQALVAHWRGSGFVNLSSLILTISLN